MTLYIQPYQFRRMARRWAEQPQQPEYNSLGVNVSEQDDAYVLSALVPGLKAEDLNIQVLENVVSIEGEYHASDSAGCCSARLTPKTFAFGSVPPCRLMGQVNAL